MAQIVQTQLHKFEQVVKPYLYEGPLSSKWGFVEQKTTVKRERFALGLLVVAVLYLAFGWGNDFLCNLTGFLYPAYASLLSVESNGTGNNTPWLVYWVIYALLGLVEYLGYGFFQTLLFYWLGKTVFLLWLMAPGQGNGSNFLYKRFIGPLVLKYSPSASQPVSSNDSYPGAYYPPTNN